MSVNPIASRHQAPSAGSTTSLRVFVVENHADTRTLLRVLLEQLGHQVFTADSMGEALRRLPSADCDVLISDIGLPDGDGWQLLQRLKLRRPIYSIAMSGFGMTSDQLRSQQAGFRHHLVKPMGPEQLESILKEAADELRGSDGGRSVASPVAAFDDSA